MELRIVAEQRLNWRIDNILLVTPASVGNNHLSELCAVVSQVIDSYHLEAQVVVYLGD